MPYLGIMHLSPAPSYRYRIRQRRKAQLRTGLEILFISFHIWLNCWTSIRPGGITYNKNFFFVNFLKFSLLFFIY